jgi:hypothetical protein
MTKIGRNAPCPCGSGLKYKKCCLEKNDINESPNRPIDFRQLIQKKEQERARWEQRYGKTRPIIHTNFDGHKWVAVGSQLHYSKEWKFFPDFLLDYIKTVLGSDWGNSEIEKPFEQRHQILKWYDGMCRFQQTQKRNKDGLYDSVPNGPFAAYIFLAYDLYILRHHTALQKEIIERLKKQDQFQGARYELFTTATCIRAGFDIEFEDEADRRKKHVEFIATHRFSGQKISVEAKSKHRKGVLGYKGKKISDESMKLRVGSLLSRALEKDHVYPLVVFIDVNLPPVVAKEVFKRPLPNEISRMTDRVKTRKNGKDRFNLLIFTNHPQHFALENDPTPRNRTLAISSQNPHVVPEHPDSIIAIHDAAMQYGNIPNEFPED